MLDMLVFEKSELKQKPIKAWSSIYPRKKDLNCKTEFCRQQSPSGMQIKFLTSSDSYIYQSNDELSCLILLVRPKFSAPKVLKNKIEFTKRTFLRNIQKRFIICIHKNSKPETKFSG